MFQGIDLQEVCNVIILVSAVIIAAKNIYGFFKKPVDGLHQKAQTAEEKHINEIVEAKVPDIVKKNQEEIVDSLEDYDVYILDITQDMIKKFIR